MKQACTILFLIFCFSCTNQNNARNEATTSRKDTVSTVDTQALAQKTESQDTVISVLVLPAYDPIANGGASPDTQYILEKVLSDHDRLKIIPFPGRKLMGVPYHMVYDKKYCTPIIEKIQTDIIIMSQIMTKNEHEPGIWPWHYEVKIYNIKADRQIKSIKGSDLEAEDFFGDINKKKDKLIADIFTTF